MNNKVSAGGMNECRGDTNECRRVWMSIRDGTSKCKQVQGVCGGGTNEHEGV